MENSPKIRALMHQIESGKLESDKARILDFIIKFPRSNTKLIQRHLRLSHETASARLSDLQDLGLLDANTEGAFSEFFYEPDPKKQKVNAFLRKTERFEKWKKKAQEFRDVLSEEQLDLIRFLNPSINPEKQQSHV